MIVEVCASLKAVKYIHKGSDRVTIKFNAGLNEIREYLSGRYRRYVGCAWVSRLQPFSFCAAAGGASAQSPHRQMARDK